MSAYRKNIMVGLTVLVALFMLSWMILRFGGHAAALFTPPQLHVEIETDRADGISDGSAVQFRGVNVGRVSKSRRAPDNSKVIIEAFIDKDPPMPGNVVAHIRSVGLIGSGAIIVLEQSGTLTRNLQNGDLIPGKWIGLDVLPPEFAELAHDLRLTSQQFRQSNLIQHMDEAVVKATQTIDGLQKMVSDEKLQSDLKQSAADLRVTMERARETATNVSKFSENLQDVSANANITLKKTQSHIDDISKQLGDRLLQVGTIMETFQSITKKVDDGKGTAGLLVNDPKLYESLVDTSKQLNLAIRDLQRLVEQWEQEGPRVRLK